MEITMVDDRRAPQSGWKFERTISVGTILTMLAMAATMLGVFITLLTKINSLEIAQAYQQSQNAQTQQLRKEDKTEFRDAVAGLNVKVDKLGEKMDRYFLEKR